MGYTYSNWYCIQLSSRAYSLWCWTPCCEIFTSPSYCGWCSWLNHSCNLLSFRWASARMAFSVICGSLLNIHCVQLAPSQNGWRKTWSAIYNYGPKIFNFLAISVGWLHKLVWLYESRFASSIGFITNCACYSACWSCLRVFWCSGGACAWFTKYDRACSEASCRNSSIFLWLVECWCRVFFHRWCNLVSFGWLDNWETCWHLSFWLACGVAYAFGNARRCPLNRSDCYRFCVSNWFYGFPICGNRCFRCWPSSGCCKDGCSV